MRDIVHTQLGRYELMTHLKSGGMAELYFGRRVEDDQIFAVKVIHEDFMNDEEHLKMFLAEAGLSVRIRHPNVVSVEEVGEDKGTPYLAMEYVHGCSLSQLLQALIRHKRRLSIDLAVYIAMQIAQGLHAAHEVRGDDGELLNVVHRDVSPQNVLLAHTGEIRVIDFGIAKSQLDAEEPTKGNSAKGESIKGKLRYMSPEHAKGQPVDRRTDVYALAIILWELLTMRPLFWAQTDLKVLQKVRKPNTEPPSKYFRKIPGALDEVLLRALEPDRNKRYASALEFRNALSQAVPFAEALDEEQISELLHAVLGEEMQQSAHALPEGVTGAVPNSGAGSGTGGSVPPTRVGKSAGGIVRPAKEALKTLTLENMEAELLERSLAGVKNPEPEVLPFGELGEVDGLPSKAPGEGVDGPTEMMSDEALQKVHDRLAKVNPKVAKKIAERIEKRALRRASKVPKPPPAPAPVPSALAPSSQAPSTQAPSTQAPSTQVGPVEVPVQLRDEEEISSVAVDISELDLPLEQPLAQEPSRQGANSRYNGALRNRAEQNGSMVARVHALLEPLLENRSPLMLAGMLFGGSVFVLLIAIALFAASC